MLSESPQACYTVYYMSNRQHACLGAFKGYTMQTIPVKLARSGMKLAKSVVRPDGVILVAVKTELTETLIARIIQAKISSIVVHGEPLDLEALEGRTNHGKYRDRLEYLFRKHKEDRFMLALRDMLISRFQMRSLEAVAALVGMDSIEDVQQDSD